MLLGLSGAFLFQWGCGGNDRSSERAEHGAAQSLTAAEQSGVLLLVNSASHSVLDDDVALDKRAADNIVAQRDGVDALLGTIDDDPFDTIEELDAVPYVGASALAKLLAYAQSEGLVVHEPPSANDAIILAVANSASVDVLDDEVALDKRAAENIVAHRDGADGVANTSDDEPFETIAELDAIPYVGASALAKLLAYGQANPPTPPPAPPSCLIISEYIEGWGNYNKAIELYNCGSSSIELASVGVCLVRNADTSCSVTATLGASTLGASTLGASTLGASTLATSTLAPGAVHGVCRAQSFTFNDPMQHITNGCDEALPGVMTFNGDDRLLLFHDADADGQFNASDDVALDAFGALSQVPSGYWWADRILRRCDLTPFDGVNASDFYAGDRFTQHPSGSGEDFGVAPSLAGCP